MKFRNYTMIIRGIKVYTICFLLSVNFIVTKAQTYQSGEVVLTSGQVDANSTSFQTTVIVGQPAVTQASSTSFLIIPGFISYYASAQFYDLSITNLILDPATTGAGNSLNLSFDILSNEAGSIRANDLTIGVYLSTDQVAEAGELLETLTVSNSIPGNSTYSFPQTGDNNSVTVPALTNPGNYYIIVSLDANNTIPETNEGNNSANTTFTVSDDDIDPVIQNVVSDTYFSTGSTVTASVNDNVGVDRVNLYHRGIRAIETVSWNGPVQASFVSGVYSVELEAAWLDELGIEFWFEAFDAANNRDTSEVNYTFYQTIGNELTLPSIPAGREQRNYRIIAIPFDLSQKNAAAIFEKYGSYDPTRWRMYHYLNGSTTEYNQGWNRLDPGKSYWLIHDVASAGQILVGEGEVIRGNKVTPYTIDLIQGWNQVGNPYRFDVNWNDVLAANGNPTVVERYRVWNNGSFTDGSTLDAFSGGFIFTTAPTSLDIPVTAITEGRIAEDSAIEEPLDNPNWQVLFNITNDDLQFNLGGLGMHPEGSINKDYYDDVAMPRLPEYIDMNFAHPEYFISRFNKDIAPTLETNTWSFTVAKQSKVDEVNISWDNTYFGDNDKAIYLIDQERHHLINMREYAEYTFTMRDEYRFKVVFGNKYQIEELLVPEQIALGQNFPNPFITRSSIPISLPAGKEDYGVEITLINSLGQHVDKIFSGQLGPGYHQITWDARSQTDRSYDPGLYVYRLRVNTGSEIVSLAKQLLIK